MHRRVLWILVPGVLALAGVSAWLVMASGVKAATAFPVSWSGADVCPPGSHEHAAGETGFFSFFTGGGSYMPRTHCMVTQEGGTDWVWVWILLVLNAIVIAGYAKIFIFWRRAYRDERPGDRNKKLMDLAYIFLWCAICGYASSIVIFFWPGYRLVALCLAPLAFFTWKFAGNLDDMRVSLSAKRLARELQESHAVRTSELERAVLERTAELEKARAVAQEASEAKSAFVANISHEIRTPLTAIIGFTEILQRGGLDEDQEHHIVDTIRRSGDHLFMLINEVLDLSKIESGLLSLELVECVPAEIASDAIVAMSQRASAKGVSLTLDLDPACEASIQTDPTRVRQILLNIISNAIKFTSKGEISVHARVTGEGDGRLIEFRVRDTGIGMTSEQRDRIFDAFRQGDDSMTRRFGGTGLGLHISRRLARELGGDIRVRSVLGEGSEFTATISAAAIGGSGSPAAGGAEDPPDIGRLIGARVLVVDDGEDNRRLAGFHLRRLGIEVTESVNGEDGVREVERAIGRGEAFSLVLMDLEMPVMDGIEATRHIKRMAPGLPVIALTAHALQTTAVVCEEAGFDDILTKPYTMKSINRVCAKWAGDRSRAA